MPMERGGEVGNVLDSGCGVGNGLDSRRVGVNDDDRATRTQTDNCHGHGNANRVLGVAVKHGPGIATIIAKIDVSRVSKQHD